MLDQFEKFGIYSLLEGFGALNQNSIDIFKNTYRYRFLIHTNLISSKLDRWCNISISVDIHTFHISIRKTDKEYSESHISRFKRPKTTQTHVHIQTSLQKPFSGSEKTETYVSNQEKLEPIYGMNFY